MRFLFTLAVLILLAVVFLLFARRSDRARRIAPVDAPRNGFLLAYPLRKGGWASVRREIPALPQTSEEKARRMIVELSLADADPAVFPPIPETFPIRSVYLDGARLYIDVAQDALQELSGGSEDERLVIESIRKTFAWNLPDLDQLQFLVDGQPRATLGAAGEDAGHIDILSPLTLKLP